MVGCLLCPTMKSKQHTYRILVIELDDVVARRNPAKPNLLVTLTVDTPERRFTALAKGKSWYSNHLRDLRLDLAPQVTFRSRETAAEAESKLVRKLKSQGFTVNRDNTVWSLYVIELDPSAVSKPGKGHIYVGQTSLTPEARFQQHIKGVRNDRGPLFARVVHAHGLRLMPNLMPKAKYYDQESAKAAEKRLAERLKERGYRVRGGH